MTAFICRVLFGWRLFLLMLPWQTAQAVDDSAAAGPLVFGLMPVVSAEHLAGRFGPLVDYLADELGREVRMETAPGFAAFIQRTHHQRRYDILFTPPHTYYLAHKKAGYQALVQVDQPGMRAAIVTRRQSEIAVLQDVAGKKLSTADPLALATILAKQALLAAGINPEAEVVLIDTPSNDASLMSMLHGNTDAAVIMMPVYRRLDANILAQTRIVFQSGLMPHIPISAAPWLPQSLAARIGDILLGMAEQEKGRAVLKRIGWPGFVAAEHRQYQELNGLLREPK